MHIRYSCSGPAFILVIAISNHLCCLMHLQQTREVVMVVTIAPGKHPIPTSSQDGNEHLQHADTLLRGCFGVDTLQSISIFCRLIHPANFFRILIQKKVCTLIKHSVKKFSVISSVQYTLSFITSLFEEMFSQSRIFYENNIILWYYQIQPTVV